MINTCRCFAGHSGGGPAGIFVKREEGRGKIESAAGVRRFAYYSPWANSHAGRYKGLQLTAYRESAAPRHPACGEAAATPLCPIHTICRNLPIYKKRRYMNCAPHHHSSFLIPDFLKFPVDTTGNPWYHHTCRREGGGPERFLPKELQKSA